MVVITTAEREVVKPVKGFASFLQPNLIKLQVVCRQLGVSHDNHFRLQHWFHLAAASNLQQTLWQPVGLHFSLTEPPLSPSARACSAFTTNPSAGFQT